MLRVIKRFLVIVVALSISPALAQSDRGTVTGTVSDPSGGVVPGAEVVLTNPATGTLFRTVTTDTGNYTIPSVPAGVYDLAVELTGFQRYEQKGIRVQVVQTARVDVVLRIGETSQSVTVQADAPLLKTENATQSTTVGRELLNDLPLNFSIGAGAIRNPLSFVQLAPGSSITGWNTIRVNGAPAGTFKIVFEGQDSTSSLDARVSDESQPSTEAIEEFALQSSNFAAEFGQVGGGLFNFTSRSGTNQFHASAYEILANEWLNAGRPFTQVTRNGEQQLLRSRVRRHDFGGSFGGPVVIPRLYNGHNRTFFFFNLEMYRDRQNQFPGMANIPTDAFRAGDFSAALTGRQLGTDGLGRPIYENVIYDPMTSRVVDGKVYRDPFPDNKIPSHRIDPVAAKIQSLLPAVSNSSLVNNFERRYNFRKIQTIPSIKVDHSLSDARKLAVYYAAMLTDKDNGQDGLPDPLSQRRDQVIRSHQIRINYDDFLTPMVLFHLGAGYQRYRNPDSSPPQNIEYDAAAKLGLKGGFGLGFPRLTGLGDARGGMMDMGPYSRTMFYQDQPTAVTSLSWIRGNHSYKFGGEWNTGNFTNRSTNGVPGNFVFGSTETGLPATQGQSLAGGHVGFPYASFLLGLVNNASVSNPQDPQYRRSAWALFAQDTWKATRKLTLDYGLRWDYQSAPHELYYRTSMFAPHIQNPAAGNLLGATMFLGYGEGRCNCEWTETYPWAFGPRLGAAYQWNEKTVLRAGVGVSYGSVAQFRYIGGGQSLGMGFNTKSFTTTAFGDPAVLLNDGLIYNPNDLLVTNYSAGIRPSPGQLDSPPAYVDREAGRPPRILSWNISLQREIFRDLVVEAAYVGNRGAWFRADGLQDFNAISPERLRSFGLDLSKKEDRDLLAARLNSPTAAARGFKAPYAGYPTTATVAQSLRPYPQFGGLGSLWAPLGNNWYDALQVRVTKRYSHGLDLTAAYTWSKTLSTIEDNTGTTVPVNFIFDRKSLKSLSVSDQPHILVTSLRYQTPGWNLNAWTRRLTGDWAVSGILRYASGYPIRVPGAQNNLGSLLFRGTFANRVPGQPLFLKDLNCHCIDPNKDFVLNPAAWADPAPGEWGTSAPYFSDYRDARRYDEQLSLGRGFKLGERLRFTFRAEFFNVFNRTYLNTPESGNAQATQKRDANGNVVSGFGRINSGSVPLPPRSGQIVLRLEF